MVLNILNSLEECESENCYGLFEEDKMLAIAEFLWNEELSSVEIANVLVLDGYQSQGIGSVFLTEMMKVVPSFIDADTSKSIDLIVSPSNERNERFYQGHGFRSGKDGHALQISKFY